jgi:hypothetical protein
LPVGWYLNVPPVFVFECSLLKAGGHLVGTGNELELPRTVEVFEVRIRNSVQQDMVYATLISEQNM